MTDRSTALSNTRILDLSDDKSIYGVKMLADLGAFVLRPETEQGDPLRRRGPFDMDTGQSLWFAYFGSSRRHYEVGDMASDALEQLLMHADLCFIGPENPLSKLVNIEASLKQNPKLVVVDCSSFGSEGPWSDFKAPDLVAGALGGSAGVTGDPESPPLKLFGDLNFTLSGVYAAVAGMAGLAHARKTGQGQKVEVPVHECIASSLEHVFMWYFYNEHFPNARARALERRGSLHWTNLYVVMPTKNGSMMVTPTPNIDAQLAWLVEEGAFQDLLDPKYEEPENRREYFVRLMEVIREWVAEEDSEDLFFKAQDRHAPYGWVQSLDQVAHNPQLAVRKWWQQTNIGSGQVRSPGVPNKFSKTPGMVADPVYIDSDPSEIATTIGWDD